MLTFLAGITPEGAVCLSVALFAASLVPFYLFVEAEHLTPRWLRQAPLTGAAFLLILTAPEATP